MAKDQENKAKAPPANVVALPSRCAVDACGKKISKMNFCDEHFGWFKEGLVNKAGVKPKDFDKKFQAFLNRKAA